MPPLGAKSPNPRIDVLVLTALQDELDAVLRLGEGFSEARDEEGYRYHVAELPSERGGSLSIAAAWIGEMGPAAAASRAASLVKELDPNCLAMCGICAGKRGDVALGDIIVASLVYDYDRGKLVARDEGQPVAELFHDITTYNLEKRWAMDAAYLARELDRASALVAERPLSMRAQVRWLLATLHAQEERGGSSPKDHVDRKSRCPDWARVVAKARAEELVLVSKGNLVLTDKGRELALEDELLHPDGLPEDPPMRVHVGPIATGSVVREDPLLFDRLARHVRKTLGVEMEAAAIGHVAAHLGRRSIIVKAVSDHADHEKDDSFRAFACRASATWLLSFLQRHLEPSGAVVPKTNPPPPPETRGGDAEMKALADKLEAAIARRNKLRKAKADTSAVDREILLLRRQLREGGVLRAGDSLGDGRYLLIDEVGHGGFARVWRARDRETETDVAIKVLRSDLANDPTRKDRFFRGARIMAELGHRSVVRVLEQKGEDGGYFYFVMEFVPGGDLRAAVLRGGVSKETVFSMILAVGEALAEAHRRGLVHRDVKPANVLIHSDGSPRLSDFDLVAAVDTTGGTRSGALGTFMYAAPECLHRPQDADARADVYSLGMTAVFALYGKELPLEVVRDAAGFVGRLDCSQEVKEVLAKATSWDAAGRFANAKDFCAALREALVEKVVSVATFVESEHTQTRAESIGKPAPGDAVTSLAFDPNGLLLVSGHENGMVCAWHTTRGWLVRTLRLTMSPMRLLMTDHDRVHAILQNSAHHILSIESGYDYTCDSLNTVDTSSIALHPLGFGAGIDQSGKVRIFHLRNGASTSVIDTGAHKVTSLAISPDGKTLYAGFSFHTLRSYSLGTGHLASVNPGDGGKVTEIAVSPDGHLVASISVTGRLKIHAFGRSPTATPATVLSTNIGSAFGLAFCRTIHDGKSIDAVCALIDDKRNGHQLHLWDAEHGEALMILPIPNAAYLAVGATGILIAVGTRDGNILLINSAEHVIVQAFSAPKT